MWPRFKYVTTLPREICGWHLNVFTHVWCQLARSLTKFTHKLASHRRSIKYLLLLSVRVSIGLVGLGCAPRRSKLQHQEVAASTEQRSSDRFEAPRRSHASPLLRTLHWLPVQQMIEYQSGSADVQSPQHLDAVVPRSPNPGSRTRRNHLYQIFW